jgi:hypothetical protein
VCRRGRLSLARCLVYSIILLRLKFFDLVNLFLLILQQSPLHNIQRLFCFGFPKLQLSSLSISLLQDKIDYSVSWVLCCVVLCRVVSYTGVLSLPPGHTLTRNSCRQSCRRYLFPLGAGLQRSESFNIYKYNREPQ